MLFPTITTLAIVGIQHIYSRACRWQDVAQTIHRKECDKKLAYLGVLPSKPVMPSAERIVAKAISDYHMADLTALLCA